MDSIWRMQEISTRNKKKKYNATNIYWQDDRHGQQKQKVMCCTLSSKKYHILHKRKGIAEQILPMIIQNSVD